jgi:hypothetical protein
MSSIGQFGVPIAQGFMQGKQYRNEQDQFRQQQGLRERQVAIGERGLDSDIKNRDREFAYRQIRDLDQIIDSPEFARKYSAGAQQKLRMRRQELGNKYPEFSYEAEPAPVTGTQPAAPPAVDAAAPPPPVPTGQALIDAQQRAAVQQQQDTQLPDFQFLNNPGKIGFDPMGGIGGNPNKPVSMGPPITGTVRPPAPRPQPDMQPPVAAGPEQPQPSLTDETRGRIRSLLEQSKDPNLSIEDQRMALDMATQLMGRLTEIGSGQANTRLATAQANEVAPNAASNRALNTENIAASQYERGEYKPGLLGLREKELELEKFKAKQKSGGMTTGEWLQMLKLQYDIKNDAANAQERERDRQWNRGQDVAKFNYQTGEGERAAETDIRRGMLRVIEKSVVKIDPVTRVPVLMKGGEEAYRRAVQQFIAQGENPTVDDLNPGFPAPVWTAVNTPGFNLQAAMNAALAAGDQRAANEYKAAADMVRRLAGGGGAAPSKPGAAQPGSGSKKKDRRGRTIYQPQDEQIQSPDRPGYRPTLRAR